MSLVEHEVIATCSREYCAVGDRADGAKRYEADVEAHQLELPILYGHTQHGGCGFNMTLDGEVWPK